MNGWRAEFRGEREQEAEIRRNDRRGIDIRGRLERLEMEHVD